MKYLDDIGDIRGKTVLVRTSLNTPIENDRVVNDFRIQKALPTLEFLHDKGARVIAMSHHSKLEQSLAPVAEELNKHIPTAFVSDWHGEPLPDSGVILLENLRFDEREMANDAQFAEELADLGDYFVQDDFTTCHRGHASIITVPKLLPSFAGLQLKAEVENLRRGLNPESPSLAVLSGAKFATKEPLIRKFLELYDTVFVGGALQNEILASRGLPVGRSKVQDRSVAPEILENERLMHVEDVVVEDEKGSSRVVAVDAVEETDTIVDIGPETMQEVVTKVQTARSMLWNGPLGWYEKGYTGASSTLAEAITAQSSKKKDGVCYTHTIVGGGDTIALLSKGAHDACTFVSTGGGAMLIFLQNGALVGIDALH